MILALGLGLFVLNVVISWFNCRTLGLGWNEMMQAGGLRKAWAYCLALMPIVGFTWTYAIVLGLVVSLLGKFNAADLTAFFNLTYIILIPELLVLGLAITGQSWVRAARDRNIASVGIAGWNSAAQIYNTINAARDFMPALSNVTDYFAKGKKDKNALIIMLFVLALLGGVLTTAMLIKYYAGVAAARVREQLPVATVTSMVVGAAPRQLTARERTFTRWPTDTD